MVREWAWNCFAGMSALGFVSSQLMLDIDTSNAIKKRCGEKVRLTMQDTVGSDDDKLTAYARLGGEVKLRAVVRDFVGKIFTDTMIGYLFAEASKERIIEMEYQFAAAHLGAEISYQGRGMRAVHARHNIMGGQFSRRKKILEETLRAHGIPGDIIDQWLAHTEKRRSKIVRNAALQCVEENAEVKES